MAYSISLQYTIVDRDSLQVKSISDELLKHEVGAYGEEKENGMVTWSHKTALHVIELRSTKAEANLNALENAFADNVKLINKILTQWNAVLLPTASHPFMNPSEAKLWHYDDHESSAVYGQLFNLHNPLWSNVNSTLFRIPFNSEGEFGKYHAAVRVLLPLLPALCASSPLIEGGPTGYLESRLSFYKNIRSRVPSLTNQLIPEPIFSRKTYEAAIIDKIKKELSLFVSNGTPINPFELNFRAAVPRFDNGYMEIRIMDVQECATADMAIVALFTEAVKALVNEKFAPIEDLKDAFTDALAGILDDTAQTGQRPEIYSTEYSSLFGINHFTNPKELWQHIHKTLLEDENTKLDHWEPELSIILEEGTLADRILKELKGDYSQTAVSKVYRELSDCLAQNKMFIP